MADNCIDVYYKLDRYYLTGNSIDFALNYKDLGGDVTEMTILGNDVFADALEERLKEREIPLRILKRTDRPTAAAKMDLVDGDKKHLHFEGNAMEEIELQDDDLEFVKQFDIIYAERWAKVGRYIKEIRQEGQIYSIGKVRKIDQKQSGIGKGAVMKKKYVLFDFDGVIADTEESNSHYLGLALKEFGVELTEKDKQRLIGTHDQELLIEFLSRAPRKVTVEQLTRRRKELGNTYENGNIAPIPGIVPLIQGLRQSGVKTALVSSTATRLIIMGLNRMQMTDLFDVIVCGDMCAERKPDPECYLKAMGLLGAVPQECLVFEDSSVGIHAAKQAGIEVAAFTGSGNGQDVSEADYVVSSYEESKRVLI